MSAPPPTLPRFFTPRILESLGLPGDTTDFQRVKDRVRAMHVKWHPEKFPSASQEFKEFCTEASRFLGHCKDHLQNGNAAAINWKMAVKDFSFSEEPSAYENLVNNKKIDKDINGFYCHADDVAKRNEAEQVKRAAYEKIRQEANAARGNAHQPPPPPPPPPPRDYGEKARETYEKARQARQARNGNYGANANAGSQQTHGANPGSGKQGNGANQAHSNNGSQQSHGNQNANAGGQTHQTTGNAAPGAGAAAQEAAAGAKKSRWQRVKDFFFEEEEAAQQAAPKAGKRRKSWREWFSGMEEDGQSPPPKKPSHSSAKSSAESAGSKVAEELFTRVEKSFTDPSVTKKAKFGKVASIVAGVALAADVATDLFMRKPKPAAQDPLPLEDPPPPPDYWTDLVKGGTAAALIAGGILYGSGKGR